MSVDFEDKLFEYSHFHINAPIECGNVRLYQFGETCLRQGGTIPEHVQVCHEISYVVAGTGMISTDGIFVKCVPGDIHLISRGMKHTITANPEEPFRYIHLAFGFVDEHLYGYEAFFKDCRNLLLQDDGTMRALMTVLLNEYYIGNAPCTGVMRECVIQAALLYVFRLYHTGAAGYRPELKSQTAEQKIYGVIRYIESHLANPLRVDELAEQFSYDGNYLSHLFKQRTGMPLKEYIVRSRLLRAEALLSEGKVSVDEIAAMCGYGSASSLYRVFKKYTGTSMRKKR